MPGSVASTDPRRWIVAAGPLEKAKPENAFRSGWGKRYFVLTHSHIFWFKKDDPYEELFGAERNKLKIADLLGGEEGISARTGADGWEEIVIRTRLPSKADALVLCRTRNAAVAAEWVAVVRAVQEELPAKRFAVEAAPRESSGSFAADLDSDDDQEPTPTPTTAGGSAEGGGGGGAAAAATAALPAPASPGASPTRSIKRSGSYKLKSSGSFSSSGGGGHLTASVLQMPVLGKDGKLAGCSICDVANNTGISAIGYLQKSRDGAIRSGWSTRLFVLTRRSLYYFKVGTPVLLVSCSFYLSFRAAAHSSPRAPSAPARFPTRTRSSSGRSAVACRLWTSAACTAPRAARHYLRAWRRWRRAARSRWRRCRRGSWRTRRRRRASHTA
jgi:hypothetical protein